MKNYRITEYYFGNSIYEFIPECQEDTLLTRLFLKKKLWTSIACGNFKKNRRGYKTYDQALERIQEDRCIVKKLRYRKQTIHVVTI